MKIGDRVTFTNEAGAEFEALVSKVYENDPAQWIDLVYVDPAVQAPGGGGGTIHRVQITHAGAPFGKGNPNWREIE